ncbi:hypothetical protein V2K59_26765 [Pseudomonas alliivorans]|nr:hypothetical protein [Pseudomonas alliivorans]
MSLSDSQLNQLDHDMAINEYEMIVLDIADARALAADVNASSQSSTQGCSDQLAAQRRRVAICPAPSAIC